MSQHPSITILFNTQHESLAACLRALLPDASVTSFDLDRTRPDPAAVLAATHIITLDVPPAAGRLATAALRAAHPSVHVLPPLRFAGFHPDTVGITLDGIALSGPAGPHHSRIAVAGYLAGLTPTETADLYNRLVFHKLGYLALHTTQTTLLDEQFSLYGLNLAEHLLNWLDSGCFMHSPTHPRIAPLMDIARLLCARMGLRPARTPTTPPDPLAALPAPPLDPDLLRAAGLPTTGAAPYDRDAFITASFAMFARVPRARLRAAPGVTSALAALNLTEPPLPETPPPPGHALLTRTGRILRLDLHCGLMLQAPLYPDSAEAQDLRLSLPALPLKSPLKFPLLRGLEAQPVPGGLITLSRDALPLTITPSHEVTTFGTDAATQASDLLPLPPAAILALRTLFAGDWRLAGADTPLPRETLTPPANFILILAGQPFDLRETTLALDHSAEGAPALNITCPGRTLTLLPDPQPTPRPLLLLPLPPADQAASPMQFRAAAGHRLAIHAPQAALHLPVTISDAHRDWFLATLAAHNLAPGARRQEAALQRRRGATLLFHPGHDGTLLTETGIANRPAPPASAPLPDGLRQDGPYLRADPALLTTGPVVQGPVCIPYAGTADDPAQWLTETLPRYELMQPHLPPGTRLLLPASFAAARAEGALHDPLTLLSPLGLTRHKILELDVPACRLEDVTWADAPLATLPAAALRTLRDRARAARPPVMKDRRLFVRRRARGDVANNAPLENFLKTHRFEFIVLDEFDALARLDLFAEAAWIMGASGPALANLLFCAPGTLVTELAPCDAGPEAYDPRTWLMAEALGLDYAVFPTPTTTQQPGAPLVIDHPRLRALFHLQSLRG